MTPDGGMPRKGSPGPLVLAGAAPGVGFWPIEVALRAYLFQDDSFVR